MKREALIVAAISLVSGMAFGQTYFEDHFDGPTLDPTWNAMGWSCSA